MNCKADIDLYNQVLEEFQKLSSDDATTAFELAKSCHAIAARMNELQFMASKIEGFDQTKTEAKQYFHQCYSLMSKAHETCRMVWRQNNEQALYFERNNH